MLALSLSGCYLSQTKIQTTDGKSYQIYGDGILLCDDSQDCKIPQRGSPHTLELEVVKNGNVVGRTTIKREITTASVFWGFLTYFVTLYVYEAYPDEVYIPLDYSNPILNEQRKYNGNGFAGGDAWNASPFDAGGSSWDNAPGAPVPAPQAVRQEQPTPMPAPQAVRQEQSAPTPPLTNPEPVNGEGIQEY